MAKRSAVARDLGGGESVKHRVFKSGEIILYKSVMVDACCYTFVKIRKTAMLRVNIDVNYEAKLIVKTFLQY